MTSNSNQENILGNEKLIRSSLLSLASLRGHLYYALMSISDRARLSDEKLVFTVCNYIHILVCSFLEEWRRFELLGKDNKAVGDTLQIVSCSIERIKKWKGLWAVRSQLLAHPNRDKNGEFVLWGPSVFNELDAPTSNAEIILLGQLAYDVLNEIALKRHADELAKAQNSVGKPEQEARKTGIRLLAEIDLVRVDMLGRMKAAEETLAQ